MAVDPEAVRGFRADRTLLAIERVRTHQKSPAGNPDQAFLAGNVSGAASHRRVATWRRVVLRTAMCCNLLHGPCSHRSAKILFRHEFERRAGRNPFFLLQAVI